MPATSSLVLPASRTRVVGILAEQQEPADLKTVGRMLASTEQRRTAVRPGSRVGHRFRLTAPPAPWWGV